jgi:hypothetical protein
MTRTGPTEAGIDAFVRRYRELPTGYYREFAPCADPQASPQRSA